MLKTAVASALLALLPLSALAQIRDFPEYKYQKYEIQLQQFFNDPAIAPHNGTYLRKSDYQRRWDGRYLCFALEDETPAKYLSVTININGYLYKGERLNSENAYLMGTAAAAIDSLCTENRAGFMDFTENINKR